MNNKVSKVQLPMLKVVTGGKTDLMTQEHDFGRHAELLHNNIMLGTF